MMTLATVSLQNSLSSRAPKSSLQSRRDASPASNTGTPINNYTRPCNQPVANFLSSVRYWNNLSVENKSGDVNLWYDFWRASHITSPDQISPTKDCIPKDMREPCVVQVRLPNPCCRQLNEYISNLFSNLIVIDSFTELLYLFELRVTCCLLAFTVYVDTHCVYAFLRASNYSPQ